MPLPAIQGGDLQSMNALESLHSDNFDENGRILQRLCAWSLPEKIVLEGEGKMKDACIHQATIMGKSGGPSAFGETQICEDTSNRELAL
jgi:hypothetical protein